MKCRVCERDLAARAFRARRLTCESCFAGQARFSALARGRVPHFFELAGPARDCVLAWETARLALCRALRPSGVHITWAGFTPKVKLWRPSASAKPYSSPEGAIPEGDAKLPGGALLASVEAVSSS